MASKTKTKIKRQIFINPSVIKDIGKALNDYTFSMKDVEKRKAKDKFMDLYQKAEFAYKELLKEYKTKVEGLVPVSGKPKKGEYNPENLNIVDSQFEKVMGFAQITVEKKLFSKDDVFKVENQKSCRILRNEITHRSSKKAINEVYNRREELYVVLKSFLNHFTQTVTEEINQDK